MADNLNEWNWGIDELAQQMSVRSARLVVKEIKNDFSFQCSGSNGKWKVVALSCDGLLQKKIALDDLLADATTEDEWDKESLVNLEKILKKHLNRVQKSIGKQANGS